MDGGDWIALTGVVLTAGFSVWSAISARQATAAEDAASKRADEALKAERAAVAAQRDIAAQLQRAADIETERARREAEQAEAAEGVPWRLRHYRGDTYALSNESDSPKFHVEISGEKLRRPLSAERIDGRGSLQFMAIPASGFSDEIVVTWHRRNDKTDPQRRWAGTKPPKP